MQVCTVVPVEGGYGGCAPLGQCTDTSRPQQLCCAQSPSMEALKAPLADWIPHMLRCEFFSPCPRHREQRKAEATFFCADCCCRPLCGHCTVQHVGHKLIQIRRYVYCDVVRATDMSPHMDISGVQTYIINQAKVMFLNQRPQSKMSRPGASDACLVCARTLREGCSYCSLACKVEALTGSSSGAPAAGGARLAKHGSGSASDSSDCWGCEAGPAAAAAAPAAAACAAADDSPREQDSHHDAGAGDSSSSGQTLAAAATSAQAAGAWGGQQDQQHERQLGGQAAWVRRHSDSDSDGRSSSGSFCCRRKQPSPRRSPLL